MELDTSVERAQLEAAKARKQIAESAYKRIREAAVTRAVTPSELDEATAQLAQAAAQVDELDAVINRKTLEKAHHSVERSGWPIRRTKRCARQVFSHRIASSGIEDYEFIDLLIPQSPESVRCWHSTIQAHRTN
ncbi:MAG: hypothetical protein R3C56_06370 [Pirellulaceae bacterium]